jgi:hypothetical protein
LDGDVRRGSYKVEGYFRRSIISAVVDDDDLAVKPLRKRCGLFVVKGDQYGELGSGQEKTMTL